MSRVQPNPQPFDFLAAERGAVVNWARTVVADRPSVSGFSIDKAGTWACDAAFTPTETGIDYHVVDPTGIIAGSLVDLASFEQRRVLQRDNGSGPAHRESMLGQVVDRALSLRPLDSSDERARPTLTFSFEGEKSGSGKKRLHLAGCALTAYSSEAHLPLGYEFSIGSQSPDELRRLMRSAQKFLGLKLNSAQDIERAMSDAVGLEVSERLEESGLPAFTSYRDQTPRAHRPIREWSDLANLRSYAMMVDGQDPPYLQPFQSIAVQNYIHHPAQTLPEGVLTPTPDVETLTEAVKLPEAMHGNVPIHVRHRLIDALMDEGSQFDAEKLFRQLVGSGVIQIVSNTVTGARGNATIRYGGREVTLGYDSANMGADFFIHVVKDLGHTKAELRKIQGDKLRSELHEAAKNRILTPRERSGIQRAVNLGMHPKIARLNLELRRVALSIEDDE